VANNGELFATCVCHQHGADGERDVTDVLPAQRLFLNELFIKSTSYKERFL
jgi:hypothetical protein